MHDSLSEEFQSGQLIEDARAFGICSRGDPPSPLRGYGAPRPPSRQAGTLRNPDKCARTRPGTGKILRRMCLRSCASRATPLGSVAAVPCHPPFAATTTLTNPHEPHKEGHHECSSEERILRVSCEPKQGRALAEAVADNLRLTGSRRFEGTAAKRERVE